jgi:zinc protease
MAGKGEASFGSDREGGKVKRVIFLSALFLIAMTSCVRHLSVTDYQLPNGLKVIIFPVKKGELVSLVTLYSIGETSDPQGKSGMAHLIEHLYVTSAAGDFPSRNVDRFMTDYPKGWNAQTGMDYTLIATVFPKSQLDREVRMAAARMKNLDINENDLNREIPRIERELTNMYGGIPMLASQNLSAAMLFNTIPKGRKGGVIEQIRTITVDELRERTSTFYKPANALIVISGAVNPGTTKKRIEELFSKIEGGKPVEAKTVAPSPIHETLQVKEITPSIPQAEPYVALSFRAPSPADRLFPAFLVIVHRLQANTGKLKPSPNIFPVIYAPFDRPEVINLNLPVVDQETPEAVLVQLRSYVDEMRTAKLDKEDLKATRQFFNFTFCRESCPDGILMRDPYGVAFTMGREKQLGINGDSIMQQITAVTQEELVEAGKYFAPEKSAAVIVKIKKIINP